MAQLGSPAGLVFKGGTALRLHFFDNFRYSADLDFSLVEIAVPDAIGILQQALEHSAHAIGFPQLILSEGDPLVIRYTGPLGREREIKLDLADDELVLERTDRTLLRRYADQVDEPLTVSTYTLNEIAAEKLRCVIQRQLCRDVSDLHRLFVGERVDVDTVWPMFQEKTQAKGLDPGRFSERLASREGSYRRHWEQELGDLEPDSHRLTKSSAKCDANCATTSNRPSSPHARHKS